MMSMLLNFASVEAGVVRLRVRRGKATEAGLRAKIDELLAACAPDAAGVAIDWETDPTAEDFVPLAQLRSKLPKAPPPAVEGDTCELCGLALAARHEHLVDKDTRALRCTCRACALLFDTTEGSQASDPRKWKRVPHGAKRVTEFQMSDAQWEALGIPIGMAFFFESGASGETMALYPGPGGVVEAPLPAGAWRAILEENRAIEGLTADVEALLVNRVRGAREVYRVSIDQCYALVGRLRTHWRGFTGGAEVWREVDVFFAALGDEGREARA